MGFLEVSVKQNIILFWFYRSVGRDTDGFLHLLSFCSVLLYFLISKLKGKYAKVGKIQKNHEHLYF